MKRRDFLKAAGTGALIATSAGTASARDNLPVSEEAVGMLYDATLCIGCRACVVKCKEINEMPPELVEGAEQWDMAEELSADTLTIIQAYNGATGGNAARLEDGTFSFSKRQCMHCVDAGCVSVCPVKAMKKDPKTGIVSHDPDACIGCRYCVMACPYNVPKYEYDEAFGQIQKCQLCNQKGVERIDQGQITGCTEVCPTGANIFGTRKELLAEAKRRLQLKKGDTYRYQLSSIDSPHTYETQVKADYQQHIFGEKEGGGTQVLVLAGTPITNLGLPELPERSYAANSETVQHTLYGGMIAPAGILAGLIYLARRNTKGGDHDE
ncbi:hydrogenase 2 operon protein HybA [Aestuariirhabdus litorea]|uniref:Hydrogenase 2 operon protein HybA n=1 Tax=Aestuariirhabdus litorea TaxID=2528527 RepID=A0A3P3VP07_9GAMM|nr:hydrogenase 2 operon protein HybA [Aestuariirhabdus litorea]RRJ83658.1 hydrogenase 2 operon protein HybA [Aestuariirhabdus litorea]RWW96880.1 hydrogenase 2 operon protein HybA [Endozoicomonadaceae bacterium GTF-13]